jgi:hypothetical protein
VSPFASEKSAAAKAKMANRKQDFIIEPDKIQKTLQFISNKKLTFTVNLKTKPLSFSKISLK